MHLLSRCERARPPEPSEASAAHAGRHITAAAASSSSARCPRPRRCHSCAWSPPRAPCGWPRCPRTPRTRP
eukprot:1449706-Pyramimonas_sp.AAC.1